MDPTTHFSCWSCSAPVDARAGVVLCPACGKVLPPSPHASPFSILGLPTPRFDLDKADVERAWLQRSRAVHPDRFAARTPTERRYAVEQTAALNGAWRVVGDPYLRARHLVDQGLKALHLPPASPTDQALLVELMDAREEADADAAARARVCTRSAERFAVRLSDLSSALIPVPATEGALRHAAAVLTELLMLARLVADLGGPKLLPTLVDR